MLKRIAILVTIIFSATFSFAQDHFIDNLTGSTWITPELINDSTISQTAEIGLTKWKFPLNNLRLDRTVITFKEGELVISKYNSVNHENKVVAVYPCVYDGHKISISVDKQENTIPLTYTMNMVSSGNFVLLSKGS